MSFITKLVLAVVVAVVAGLLLVLLGSILVTLGVPIATTVGNFFEKYGFALGILAGFWYYFAGFNFTRPTV
jgi:hypothetical protein